MRRAGVWVAAAAVMAVAGAIPAEILQRTVRTTRPNLYKYRAAAGWRRSDEKKKKVKMKIPKRRVRRWRRVTYRSLRALCGARLALSP